MTSGLWAALGHDLWLYCSTVPALMFGDLWEKSCVTWPRCGTHWVPASPTSYLVKLSEWARWVSPGWLLCVPWAMHGLVFRPPAGSCYFLSRNWAGRSILIKNPIGLQPPASDGLRFSAMKLLFLSVLPVSSFTAQADSTVIIRKEGNGIIL